MSKPRILLVGEHPLGTTGNCGMMHSFVTEIDYDKYDISCACVGDASDVPSLMFKTLPFPIIPLSTAEDFWGGDILMEIVKSTMFDAMVFIGVDLWRYLPIMPELVHYRDQKRFKIGWLFPYDLLGSRKELVEIANALDMPCVYSQYGFDILSPDVKHLRYFRPPLQLQKQWNPISKQEVAALKRNLFQGTDIPTDVFMVGFIGVNQYRKDPQKMLRAYSDFVKEYQKAVLYLHTDTASGVFNLAQYGIDLGIETGKILSKPDGKKYPLTQMPKIFNCFDVYVNCSIQEGLSWTVVESMLCGVPPIISDTTAHKDFDIDPNLKVKCETPVFLPIISASGQTWVEANACESKDIYKALKWYYTLSESEKDKLKCDVRATGVNWIENCHLPNDLISILLTKEVETVKVVKDEVLFAQHSAAGDVFMTTRCLKGIKERHPDTPLVYMTQEKYHDILVNNPYIDELIPWQPHLIEQGVYAVSYNPHGDVILPGHWGRNCNSILSDFYWKILRVEPSDFFIELKEPSASTVIGSSVRESIDIDRFCGHVGGDKVAVVHTTGGDSHFRTYKYMAEVSTGLRQRGYYVVQLGGAEDYDADADIDFRGRLSYRESAWVMSQANIAVTVDSFTSHLAGSLGVDQVCLFGSGNYVVVQPWQRPGSTLTCMVPDYVYDCKGLGPCSASVRDCPVPCTGRHKPEDILDAIDEIIEQREEL